MSVKRECCMFLCGWDMWLELSVSVTLGLARGHAHQSPVSECPHVINPLNARVSYFPLISNYHLFLIFIRVLHLRGREYRFNIVHLQWRIIEEYKIGYYWSFHFFIFFCTFFMRRESVIRSVVIIPRFWTVWVTYVYTKERYRPQRDSNPVPPGSESTTLPMSYPGAIYLMRALII